MGKEGWIKETVCHCEERCLRRGNLEFANYFRTEIASLRSQRQQKDFFRDLLLIQSMPAIQLRANGVIIAGTAKIAKRGVGRFFPATILL
jgi:hypothetical protein